MVNFGPLTAEIGLGVWGTPTNFNGFCILAALLHVEEFNISTPSLVFLPVFYTGAYMAKIPLQTITGAILKNSKLE